jgi:putative membrane protein
MKLEARCMRIAGEIIIGVVALLHLYFLVLEMFLWTTPRGLAAFGQSLEDGQTTRQLAANLGLYNGFLAAGLVWSLITSDPARPQFQVFFLACVITAGAYAGLTFSKKIFYVQSVPAIVALALVLLGRA